MPSEELRSAGGGGGSGPSGPRQPVADKHQILFITDGLHRICVAPQIVIAWRGRLGPVEGHVGPRGVQDQDLILVTKGGVCH